MSNSRPPNSGKTEISGTTIGFRFYANEEELEEVQSKDNKPDIKEENIYFKIMTDILKPEVLDGGKVLIDNKDTTPDAPKDQRNLLGKRSVSVDSAPESSFPSPVERWKKFSELKEKITKTVEEKISEMKMERNVLGKTRLMHSKENSSISDSEDTSESSKISTTAEQWKDVENQVSSPKKTLNETSETVCTALDTSVPNVKKELESKEGDSELRNRLTDFSNLINLPNIKIAVAKNDEKSSAKDDTLGDDVESGVEADENLNPEESDSLVLSDSGPLVTGGMGNNFPPFEFAIGSTLTSVILTQTNTVMFFLLFLFYLFYPLPEFLKGCLLSFLLMSFWGTFKHYVRCDAPLPQQVTFDIPDYKAMPPLKVPKCEMAKGVWFNEYEQETYDPDYYSVTQTVPVYIELEGSTLTISRAKGKIRRRATFDEPEYKLPIIGKRVFNIKGCNIFLLPEGLTRKRLFSKKYPIVIVLKKDSLISETKNGKEIDDKELDDCYESDPTVLNKPVSPKNKCTLFLFARCDRQKEEWYRRLLAACKASTPTAHTRCAKTSESGEVTENEAEIHLSDDSPCKDAETPFENLCFVDESTVLDEYYAYMSTFASFKKSNGTENSQELKETEEEEEVEEEEPPCSQTQWFNAFVNRILFDVFRSPYWLSKIQEKVQRKIHSIRMPYYIEDIEVIEMDLGKTGPMFHRVSPPHLDDRGLWFDMDLTFNGLVRLTVQTQLNLVKLQRGNEDSEGHVPAVPTPEKSRKGKKSDKSEKESKPVDFSKDSTEMREESIKSDKKSSWKHTSRKVSLESKRTENGASENVPKPTEEFTANKLVEEVSELAEIAIEEVISANTEKGVENSCLCSKRENSQDFASCACADPQKVRSPIYDSDLEDSAESSSEEDEEPPEEHHVRNSPPEEPRPLGRRYPRNRRSSKKIFKVFENVAQSKYFKSMAQSKYIQKAIANVSAAKLRLTLEIKSCTGVLVINIPPPPSDRFWYGFRKMPTLVFSANPKIGDKTVRLMHIKNYLQKKILYEVKKVMVAPNMIDFVLPTSAPAQSSSFVHDEEPDLQEGSFSK